MHRLRLWWLALPLVAAGVVMAEEPWTAPYVGRAVASVIDEFRYAGEPFAYSTNIVTEELHVISEPDAVTPLEIVRQILQPHGLAVREEAGVYLVIRAKPTRTAPPAEHPGGDKIARSEIETVIVAASRYEISRDISVSKFAIDQRTIQNMPDIGEDPVRASQRLPGAAASGASAMAHFRGGEENEVGIMLNGQWLFDPFHIRDYQSIFSAIDARAIQGVEVYTGGFPVRYGDRMSGLVLMETLDSDKPRHTEIGLSVFNTSFLSAGKERGHDWLFSARRGNLDLVIDSKIGQPSYFDVFGEVGFDLSDNARLSINALYADDGIKLVLESDPLELEQVRSDSRNAQLWIRLDNEWSSTLSSSTVVSLVDYQKVRIGSTGDAEKMIASVRDVRDVRQFGLRQDWAWRLSETHHTRWGVEASSAKADYSYDGVAEYFGLQALYAGQPERVDRRLQANPDGGSYALYLSDRWRINERATLEWGLRWDDQTYPEGGSDAQLSPRLSVLLRTSRNLEVRLSAGRYHQSQPVQALQIEDGVDRFWPAQRADHLIAGFRYLTESKLALRVEAFRKEIRDVRPRFENLYDPLGIVPELQADRVRLDPSRASARGVELSADLSKGAWNGWASYTWSKVTDRIGNRNVPRSWDQRHALQAGVDWQNESWNFSAAMSVHSGWPATDLALLENGVDEEDEPVFIVIPGERNAQRHPTFASVDMRLSRRFDVRRGTLLAFVEVSNVLNRRNVCCRDWDIGEDALGNDVLEYSLDYWMPLLPAIGILWEF